MRDLSPHLDKTGPAANAAAVVLLLHGGEAHSVAPARPGLAWARMIPFHRGLARATADHGTAVWLLRYRVRGWNGPAQDPLPDAQWALAEARRRHPGAPIVLVGHSMGGRVALHLAGEPSVVGVCALAPWIEPGDPRVAVSAQVLIAHGELDSVTDPVVSAEYAAAIGASFVSVPGEWHAMLRRPLLWQRLVRGFVLRVIGADEHVR